MAAAFGNGALGYAAACSNDQVDAHSAFLLALQIWRIVISGYPTCLIPQWAGRTVATRLLSRR